MIAPAPQASFRWIDPPCGRALRCEALAPLADHLFTTRAWALGAPSPADLRGAWGEVASALRVDEGSLIRLRQIHGSSVLVARDRADGGADADIVVTAEDRIAVAVQTADCIPVLTADSGSCAVGAAHVGWRGLASRVPAALVAAMAREFGSRPSDLIIAAGPSIGPCCYEVGEDVRERFEREHFTNDEMAGWFLKVPASTPKNPSAARVERPTRRNHSFFDLWSAVRDQFASAGVGLRNIHIAELCTASHPEDFCSYRRDGALAGRMAAAIRCPRSR